MRLLPGLLISTLALGTFAITGCAEHRYRTDPYYGYGGGYSGTTLIIIPITVNGSLNAGTTMWTTTG